jgi:uncharacterized protein YjbI with pentapeptide repeats
MSLYGKRFGLWYRLLALGVLLPLLATLLFAQENNQRSVIHARQLRSGSPPMARANQLVVLDELSPNFDGHEISYFLDAGVHEFCLRGGESAFPGFTVRNEAGEKLLQVNGNPRCSKAEFSQGIYRVLVRQKSSSVLPPDRAAAIEVDPFNPAISDASGNALPGYWGVQVDSSLDPAHRTGLLRQILPPLTNQRGGAAQGIPFIPLGAVFNNQQIDRYSLFEFSGSDVWHSFTKSTLSQFYTFDLSTSSWLGVDATPCPNDHGCDPLLRTVTNMGHYQFQLKTGFFPLGFVSTPTSPLILSTPENPPFATFTAVYRYFPDGNVGTLQPGEVALWGSCNYSGPAIVIGASSPVFQEWDSADVPLGTMGQSIKFGNNTSGVLFTGVNYAGSSSTIITNTSCRPNTPPIGSLQIQSSTSILAATNACPGCLLNGVNLSGQKLSGANLNGAQLNGAVLTNTSLNGASLAGANLTGSTISCTDFSGTAQQSVDLSSTTLASLKFVSQSGCRANFSYTTVPATAFPPSQIPQVNLTGAVLLGLKDYPLSSQAQPLNISGAQLTGASLEYATLDYSTGWSNAAVTGIQILGGSFQFADMQSVDMSNAVLNGANLSNAKLNDALLQKINLATVPQYGASKLYGTILIGANLDGATLQGASLTNTGNGPATTLEGAFLRNVNLSSAQLSGVDFTNASFYGIQPAGNSKCAIQAKTYTANCASASGATMNNTLFSNAYLFGVDFSGSNTTIQGVQFANSVLVGANFSQANISVDPLVKVNSGFGGAFLQGTNLGPPTTLNGVTLYQAFVDFRPQGNSINLMLDGKHTQFRGYWGTAGVFVCAEMNYTTPTQVPTINSTITCPNGSTTSCGSADPSGANVAWNGGVDLSSYASYQFNSTYTAAKKVPVCKADLKWSLGL